MIGFIGRLFGGTRQVSMLPTGDHTLTTELRCFKNAPIIDYETTVLASTFAFLHFLKISARRFGAPNLAFSSAEVT